MKVSVVGSGMVGSTFAYRLLISGMASEIVMIDVNNERALGEAEDMSDAISVEVPMAIRAGSIEDAKDSSFVIVTAGLSNLKDGTRLDLCAKNAEIFKDIIPKLAAVAPHAFFIIASNPMDVMTCAAMRYSGLPKNQIIGSGTVLDSARLRYFISQKIGISPTQISAYTLGEHGDSQVPIWSQVSVRGISLESVLRQQNMTLSEQDKDAIREQVVTSAYRIISRKMATYYGIGSAMLRIVRAIWRNERVLLPVSTLAEGDYGAEGICMAMPALVGNQGVEKIFDLSVSQDEYNKLLESAKVLKTYVDALPN